MPTGKSSRKNVGSNRTRVSLFRLGNIGRFKSSIGGNPTNIMYLFGSNNVDGSVRFSYIPPGQSYHLAYRHTGIWRDSDIVLDEFTLSRELDITFDREGHLAKARVF